MSTSLTLTGAIPGLLRRGSPGMWFSPLVHGLTVLDVRAHPLRPAGRFYVNDGVSVNEWCDGADVALDLTDPTGRFHALLWLRERGHDLRWAEDEPEVLAWSVLSVARGGGPIVALALQWYRDPYMGFHARDAVKHTTISAIVSLRFNTTDGGAAWQVDDIHGCGIAWGRETGDAGKAAADAAALAAGCALRNEDGTLTLPPLPEVA